MNIRIFHTEIAAIDQQVFRTVEIGVQRIELRDHAQLRFDRQRVAWHLQAQGCDASAVGSGQAQAHPNGGCFSRAVGANHAQAFTRRNRKRKVIDHSVVAKAFA